MRNKDKPIVMLSYYNRKDVGGPNRSMEKLQNSYLREKYQFVPIEINGRYGKLFRIDIIAKIVKKIRNVKPDIIYFTGLQLQGFYMALGILFSGYRSCAVMVVHGSSCDALQTGGFFRWIFGSVIEPISLRIPSITHTVSMEMAGKPMIKRNVRYFGGVIPNAVPDIDIASNRGEDIRGNMGLAEDDFVFLYTGRLVYDKGIEYLLEAFSYMKNDAKLVLVGDGEIDRYKEMTRGKKLENEVIFTGARTNVYDYLAAADAFVFPTLHENFSNSLLEACVCELPVIATDVGDNAVIIRNELDGVIIPPADAQALYKAMNSIINMTSEDRRRMGSNGRKHVTTDYSQKQIFSRIDKLFEGILANKK